MNLQFGAKIVAPEPPRIRLIVPERPGDTKYLCPSSFYLSLEEARALQHQIATAIQEAESIK